MMILYDKVKGDMSHIPGDENDDIILIKSKGNRAPNDILGQMRTLGSVVNKPEKPETPTPLKGKPGRKGPGGDERPGLEKLNVRDKDCEAIKVTGNQLNHYGKPDEKINEVNPIRTIFKDADDDDSGIN